LTLNRRLARYTGRDAVLTQSIVNGAGRIRLDDSFWSVRGPDCPAGSIVTITGSDGTVLLVTRKEE
jgi:membrane protein implicated in regulation of membrane protease activity